MGGKRLKFPVRQKYVDTSKDLKFDPKKEEEKISEEEHNKRLELLKSIGLIKEG